MSPEDTQRLLLAETRHQQNTERFLAVEGEIRGLKGRTSMIESEMTQVKAGLADNTALTKSVKQDTLSLVEMSKWGARVKKAGLWGLATIPTCILAYNSWPKK